MKKVFKWLDFLRECEPKTMWGVIVAIGVIFVSVYNLQANISRWIVNTENAISDGKIAIEQAKIRDKKVYDLEIRTCIVENNFVTLDKKIDGVDKKLDIIIARIK